MRTIVSSALRVCGRNAPLRGAVAAAAALTSLAQGAQAAAAPDALAQASWRTAISRTPTPRAGCFEASYPTLAWSKVDCVAAPRGPYSPGTGGPGPATVGHGADYAIKTKGLIATGAGTFPVVTNVTSETEHGLPNAYSLQMNSQFWHDGPTCSGAKTPSKCLSWLQFVYSSSQKTVFMEYWLLSYHARCPAGWTAYGSDCFISSAAVHAPQEPITDLAAMSLTASAVKSGLDTMVFADGAKAYTTTGEDSVLDLADAWTQAEFNVFGDGGGAQAVFNTGASITVNVAVDDGGTKAPKCKSGGTTGETNNLDLGACTSAGGPTPSITFVESN